MSLLVASLGAQRPILPNSVQENTGKGLKDRRRSVEWGAASTNESIHWHLEVADKGKVDGEERWNYWETPFTHMWAMDNRRSLIRSLCLTISLSLSH